MSENRHLRMLLIKQTNILKIPGVLELQILSKIFKRRI